MALIKCKNCSTENNYYELNCVQCGSLIRARVVNIDLWHIIWLVIDSPKKAFQTIIHAEHKNFISLLGILVSIKIYFDVQFSSNFIFSETPVLENLLLYLVVSIPLFIILTILLSLLIKFLNSRLNIKTRFKDNLAIYIYSFLPILAGLIFLLPVEYALFGNHWLTFDPSPFIIRSSAAWIMVALEIALHLWSIVLTMIATFAYTGRVLYSIITGIVVHLIIYTVYFAIAGII